MTLHATQPKARWQWRRALPVMGVLAGAGGPPPIYAFDLPEGTSKLSRADEIYRTYVMPLGLKGTTASSSINRLLAEGFRCELKHASSIGLREPPLSRCFKQPSGFGELCDELIVTLRFPGQPSVTSNPELLAQLDHFTVGSAATFCPYGRGHPRKEFITGRQLGEEGLAAYARSLNGVSNARAALDQAWVDGYACGFELDPATHKPKVEPKLVCTQWPGKVKYCYEAKLTIEGQWGTSPSRPAEPLGALKTVNVRRVESSCELPAVRESLERAPSRSSGEA